MPQARGLAKNLQSNFLSAHALGMCPLQPNETTRGIRQHAHSTHDPGTALLGGPVGSPVRGGGRAGGRGRGGAAGGAGSTTALPARASTMNRNSAAVPVEWQVSDCVCGTVLVAW